ncbi:MAG: two-component system, chemotaxis family, protein-glutamate methylesterase/glutaminase [Solirubrobacteraceae bacterium]|nr:two-component system, chemotaxis family, protein-glutamate methylesterase/glutaminase [Solirubrobacteraceae bacterium]
MSSPALGVAAPVTVIVVDDSTVQRRLLRGLIEADHDLTVVGEARTGKEAVALVERLRPGVVLMDLDLPVMNGIEAIEKIMAVHPTPILVYSAFVDGTSNANGVAAIAAGAVDVIAKPSAGSNEPPDVYGDALRKRLRVASRVRVITHPRARLRPRAVPFDETAVADGHAVAPTATNGIAPKGIAPTGIAPTAVRQRPAATAAPVSRLIRGSVPVRQIDLIAIGVSTGGPQALVHLLGSLPPDLRQAVVVVQHMADGFLQGLADWLGTQCVLPVVLGQKGHKLEPGQVTIAPGGHNMIIGDRLRVSLEVPPPGQFHVPGIDACFTSIANHVGSTAIGVILTGMGRDGAAGLKLMRENGAVTIGQDEATCAVYGMPAAAMAIGAVEHELPLLDIAPMMMRTIGHASAGVS